MSDFLNFGDFEPFPKERKEPAPDPSAKSSKGLPNEKPESVPPKKKKKLTNLSDPSILESDLLNESYSEISNNQLIRVPSFPLTPSKPDLSLPSRRPSRT